MRYKELYSFAYNCVSMYAKFDKLNLQYEIDVNHIPDIVQQEFAALIMSKDDDRANESTGADNPSFYKDMVPSLIKLLNDSTNKDSQIEFIEAWRDGVTSYHKECMQAYLDEACWEYNSERDLCKGEVA